MPGLESSRWARPETTSKPVPSNGVPASKSPAPASAVATPPSTSSSPSPTNATTVVTTATTTEAAPASTLAPAPSSLQPKPDPAARQAPPKPAVLTATSHGSPAAELARHRLLLQRMRWKLPALADSHRRATQPSSELSAEEKRVAELFFKLDFFEYYALLEQTLLRLLGVFGITVSARGDLGTRRTMRGPYGHSFHENVLNALEKPNNPLYDILGVGDVKEQLYAAKTLRNRWKDAQEHCLQAADDDTSSPPPLAAWEIERMLGSIFDAFDKAQEVAEKAVSDAAQNEGKGHRRKLSWASAMEMDGDIVIEGEENGEDVLDTAEDPMDWQHML